MVRESQRVYPIRRSNKKSPEVETKLVETDPDRTFLPQAYRRGTPVPQGLHSTARKFNFESFHRVYTHRLQSLVIAEGQRSRGLPSNGIYPKRALCLQYASQERNRAYCLYSFEDTQRLFPQTGLPLDGDKLCFIQYKIKLSLCTLLGHGVV
jgi:hypothetical protein